MALQVHRGVPSQEMMILDTCPSSSLMSRYADAVKLKFIGYWGGSRLPLRVGAQPKPADNLPNPENYVDWSWNIAELATVADYLIDFGVPRITYRGFSWCRFLCGAPPHALGCEDVTDGTYVWPSGFGHYLRMHGVKPPQEFIDHVKRAVLTAERQKT
jgi:hypothetical protein